MFVVSYELIHSISFIFIQVYIQYTATQFSTSWRFVKYCSIDVVMWTPKEIILQVFDSIINWKFSEIALSFRKFKSRTLSYCYSRNSQWITCPFSTVIYVVERFKFKRGCMYDTYNSVFNMAYSFEYNIPIPCFKNILLANCLL